MGNFEENATKQTWVLFVCLGGASASGSVVTFELYENQMVKYSQGTQRWGEVRSGVGVGQRRVLTTAGARLSRTSPVSSEPEHWAGLELT